MQDEKLYKALGKVFEDAGDFFRNIDNKIVYPVGVGFITAYLTLFSLVSCEEKQQVVPTAPETPEIENPATEIQGRQGIKDGITYALSKKGITTYSIVDLGEGKYVAVIGPNKAGYFDIVAHIDINGDGIDDLDLAGNYVTDGEAKQNVADSTHSKNKETKKSSTPPVTTQEYIKNGFGTWAEDMLEKYGLAKGVHL